MQYVSIYRRGDGLYFVSNSKSPRGLWFANGTVARLDAGAAPGLVGRTSLEMLDASRSPAPMPDDPGRVKQPLLELAGVSSWGTFSRGASLVGLEAEGDLIRMIPYRNLGPQGGFEEIRASASELPRTTPDDRIAADLGRAFERSE